VREEIHSGSTGDPLQENVDSAPVTFRVIHLPEEGDQSTFAVVFAGQPSVDPKAGEFRQGVAGAQADDEHVGFGGSIGRLIAESGVAKVIEAPPSALKIVVVEEVLGQVIVELHGLVSSGGILVSDDEVEGVFGLPGSSIRGRIN